MSLNCNRSDDSKGKKENHELKLSLWILINLDGLKTNLVNRVHCVSLSGMQQNQNLEAAQIFIILLCSRSVSQSWRIKNVQWHVQGETTYIEPGSGHCFLASLQSLILLKLKFLSFLGCGSKLVLVFCNG